MPNDREDLRTEETPAFFDDEDEDEILAELRQIRREMLAEFPSDEALLRAMKPHEAEEFRQGRPVISIPPEHPEDDNPYVA
jgi:hypothetical protein